MKKTVNQPIAKTFGWLRVNGTEVDIPNNKKTEQLTMNSGEERTIIVEPDVSLEALVPEKAVLKLIQVRENDNREYIGNVRVRCARDARFEWYLIVLNGKATFSECSVVLEGDGSSFAGEIGYRLEGNSRLDINCEAIHTGRKTESSIRASGVLSDQAFKLLRGTIDLRTGCSGSIGNEMEDVLLLSEDVHNQSVPVILCSEEDVVGNHGATIGQLGDDLLFYLESRGMTRESIYEMMANAKLNAVIEKLPDEDLQKRLSESLQL